MNTKIIIVSIVLLIVVGTIITVNLSSNTVKQNIPNQTVQDDMVIENDQNIETQQNIYEQKVSETDTLIEDGELLLKRDRDTGARGAQKKNSDASTLQNDLNSAGNP